MQIPAANRTAQLFDSIDAARNWLGRRVGWPAKMPTIEDRDRMLDYAQEFDEQAARLEASIARSA
ncbi:hypothetical protein [Reyranella sp.]|jgi:hypothetical protein|uniref:hypothetical protein n=1 Tax=Reyranella sp. TaxID=1929291 RepID=UPI000BD335D8|nr:hypothetical protein [Reyranella sp.]OYY37165.1 MAG: hypothetical protein B7Y57_23210 [Rhodospirillales bacterium 35-66-84]OYZ94136.1 MAG: hypothetical protein B7Y08_13445 [Rhodospirillales bacterium 24-66-33]OZB22977.1 MAG: hypothetical protein B7X63_20595 [Rhodospirillales bacterium 39-66-50]HQS17151.1 hypothetical protein [Reyranella sp.]HQT13778.1 hypothetical protein [Reyranella sp.]